MSRRSYRVSPLVLPTPSPEREHAHPRWFPDGAEYPPEMVGNPSVLKMALESASTSPTIRMPQLSVLSVQEATAAGGSGKLPLHLAVEFGNVDCVRELLQYKTQEVHAHDSAHETPCMIAARRGDARILSLLLEAMPDVSSADLSGETALHKAALGGFSQCIKLLLKSGASVHALNNMRQTALIKACKSESPAGSDCALLLLNADSYVNIQDEFGFRAINYAARKCNRDCIRALLARGADMYGQTDHCLGYASPVETAILGNNVAAMQCFLEAGLDASRVHLGSDFHRRFRTILSCACSVGLLEMVTLLLKHGENPNKDYPLLHAAVRWHSPLVKLLLQHGAIPDPRPSAGNRLTIVEEVLCSSHQPTDPDSARREEMMVDVLKPLLRAGAQVNRKFIRPTSQVHSPLTRAVSMGCLRVVKLLLVAGAMESAERLAWAQQLHNGPDLDMVTYLSEWMEDPRSLQHLSRGMIRQCMGVHVTRKIDSLSLGKPLRRFLHLEELGYLSS